MKCVRCDPPFCTCNYTSIRTLYTTTACDNGRQAWKLGANFKQGEVGVPAVFVLIHEDCAMDLTVPINGASEFIQKPVTP